MGVYSATEYKLIKVIDLKHRFCVNVLVVEYTITVASHERFITSTLTLLNQNP